MRGHLVIVKKPYLDLILRGDKTIELRLTKGKTSEFGRVLPGDTLFLKISSGPVCATATISAINRIFFKTRPPPLLTFSGNARSPDQV